MTRHGGGDRRSVEKRLEGMIGYARCVFARL
jgi:hypothetical protein